MKDIQLLIVEDNKGDARLLIEAFKQISIHHVHHVIDGVEALSYIRKQAPYQQAVRPDLILMDINMPRKSGIETLEEIRKDPSFSTIPIIILTTSSLQEDIELSYKHHANCFITKPMGLEAFLEVVQKIEEFWLNCVKLPNSQ